MLYVVFFESFSNLFLSPHTHLALECRLSEQSKLFFSSGCWKFRAKSEGEGNEWNGKFEGKFCGLLATITFHTIKERGDRGERANFEEKGVGEGEKSFRCFLTLVRSWMECAWPLLVLANIRAINKLKLWKLYILLFFVLWPFLYHRSIRPVVLAAETQLTHKIYRRWDLEFFSTGSMLSFFASHGCSRWSIWSATKLITNGDKSWSKIETLSFLYSENFEQTLEIPQASSSSLRNYCASSRRQFFFRLVRRERKRGAVWEIENMRIYIRGTFTPNVAWK